MSIFFLDLVIPSIVHFFLFEYFHLFPVIDWSHKKLGRLGLINCLELILFPFLVSVVIYDVKCDIIFLMVILLCLLC